MNTFNDEQLELVKKSEEPWFYGVRHKLSSGEICESLLRDYLKQKFPNLEFKRGNLTNDPNVRGAKLKSENVSPQVDIVCYHGNAVQEWGDYVLVDKSKALFVIEIKKMVDPTGAASFNKQIRGIKKFSKRIIFVGFVVKTPKNNGAKIIQNLKESLESDATYFFSYIWRKSPFDTENAEETFAKLQIPGELESLIKKIQEMAEETK